MCDNIVALGKATADGSVLFGKNSDREPNEPHALRFIPRTTHSKGSETRCTYIEIPQVEETYAVLLGKPSWLWGAEMGANEHGLTIGNTAVFTKMPYQTGPGLVGMDYLRLALERSVTAREAVDLITALLARYGQGGNDGFAHKLYYHNSFLIADPSTAWILETSGQQWVARQVRDIGVTSNTLTIETEWDLASERLVDYAIEQGWCKREADFNFKECYGGPGLYPSYLYTFLGQGDERFERLTDLLEQYKGHLTVELMMDILRDHGPQAGLDYSPSQGFFDAPPCMHAGFGPVRVGQATGSMVSRLTPENQIHWLTGTSAPCTSLFKPVWIEAGLPDIGPVPTGRYNHTSLWWRHEALHREVLRDYSTRLALYKAERDTLESKFIQEALKLNGKSVDERAAFSTHCFEEADRMTSRWEAQVRATPPQNSAFLYQRAWRKRNEQVSYIAGERRAFVDSPGGD